MNQPKRDTQVKHLREPYTLPLPPVLIIGAILSVLFYGLIKTGPLNFDLLKRYCLSHWVAVASVCLFLMGMTGLAIKWLTANHQLRLIGRSSAAVRRLIGEGQAVGLNSRVDWLLQSWSAEPAGVRASWIGQRIVQVLQLQQSRGRRHNLEQDLKLLADQTADMQYESYSLLRIVHWAMPMLGFLGTVLGISQTLGQLDTEMLATQQQEAMNQLTGGLYVAFDTTAIALVLTVCSMFIQFAVNRVELNLMQRINRECEDSLIAFLAADPFDAQNSLLEPIREMAGELISCVRDLVTEQAQVWSNSITESQRQWSDWTHKLASEVDSQLVGALGDAMTQHLSGLEHVHEKTGRQFEVRLQQWQTTLSEQTRALHNQQKEMVTQTATLQQLIQSTTDLKKLESVVSDNLRTLEEGSRFIQATSRIETASQCVAEAVAMLATSLERAGVVRAAPKRPRAVASSNTEATASQPSESPSDVASSNTAHSVGSISNDGSTARKGKAA